MKDQQEIKLVCQATETVVRHVFKTDNWRLGVKAAVQLHPELPGPFIFSRNYLWTASDRHDGANSLYEAARIPRKIDGGISLTQGRLSGSRLYLAYAVEATTGKRRVCPVRLNGWCSDVKAVMVAVHLYGKRHGWEHPLTLVGVIGQQYSQHDFVVSRSRIQSSVASTLEEQFPLIESNFDDRVGGYFKPGGSDDLLPSRFLKKGGSGDGVARSSHDIIRTAIEKLSHGGQVVPINASKSERAERSARTKAGISAAKRKRA